MPRSSKNGSPRPLRPRITPRTPRRTTQPIRPGQSLLQAWIPVALAQRLRDAADARGISVAGYVRMTLLGATPDAVAAGHEEPVLDDEEVTVKAAATAGV